MKCDRGDVYAHELGHNLGMRHASFDVDVDGIVDATCPWGGWSGGGEYCDDSDFMGISTNVWRQTNAPPKVQMGWVPSDRVVDVTSSGTYTIAPLEVYPGTTGLPLVLRIAKPGGYYYASYRRRVGYDAAMRLAYAARTSVHGHGGGNTMLHAYLGDGQAFQDSGNGIGIAQVAHDVGAVQIAVTLECGNGVIDAGEQCDGTNLGGATCGGCAGTPTCTEFDQADLTLTQEIPVRNLAAACGTYYKAFKSLNPWIRGANLPAGSYPLKLPKGTARQLHEALRR